VIFSGVTILQGGESNFPHFLLIFACELQQRSVNALAVIITRDSFPSESALRRLHDYVNNTKLDTLPSDSGTSRLASWPQIY